MNKKAALTVVVAIDPVISAFCGFECVALTSRMIYSTELVETRGYQPMAHSG